MTEGEAKKKWCPMAKGISSDTCISSECMMWEPYEYCIDKNNKIVSCRENGSKSIKEGDCGLKSQALECNGF